MGMEFKPEGIEFAPMVPEGMPGKKTLNGFIYRKSVLDFTLEGTGNDIASITIDNQPMESAFLPNDIQGQHHIAIMLKDGKTSNQKVTIHHDEILLPPTPTVVWQGDTGRIVDYVPGTPYRLSVNGDLKELNDSVFVLPQTDAFT